MDHYKSILPLLDQKKYRYEISQEMLQWYQDLKEWVAGMERIGIYLTGETIAQTWQWIEELLVSSHFSGTLYICRSADLLTEFMLHIPFFQDISTREAHYTAGDSGFAMELYYTADGTFNFGGNKIDLLLLGTASADCITQVDCPVISMAIPGSSQGLKSFFMIPFAGNITKKLDAQKIFYYLDQFIGEEKTESYPLYKCDEVIIDEAINQYYLNHFKSFFQNNYLVDNLAEILARPEELKVAIVVQSWENCYLSIFNYLKAYVYRVIGKQFLYILARDEGGFFSKLITEFANLGIRMEKIDHGKPLETLDLNTIYLFETTNLPQRYLDYVIYTCQMPFLDKESWDSVRSHMGLGPFYMHEYENRDWIVTDDYMSFYSEFQCLKDLLTAENPDLDRLVNLVYSLSVHWDENEVIRRYIKELKNYYGTRNKLFCVAGCFLYAIKNIKRRENRQTCTVKPEELYQVLFAAAQTGEINLSISPVLTPLSKIFTLLAGTGCIRVSSPEAVEYEYGVSGHTVIGITISSGQFFTCGCTFTGDFSILDCEGTGEYSFSFRAGADETFAPPLLPWLTFEAPRIEVSSFQEGQMPNLRVYGTMADNALTAYVDIQGTEDICTLTGIFNTPLTALDSISALTGGLDFSEQLPSFVRGLGSLALKGFVVNYDNKQSKVNQFSLTFGTEEPWQVLEEPSITVSPAVKLDIYNPADFSNRSFHIMLQGDCVIGEGNGILRMEGSYPPLYLSLKLLEGQEYSVKTLLNDCGVKQFHDDLLVDSLNASIKPDEGQYHFSASVRNVWSMANGKFEITALGLLLDKNASGFHASFAGAVLLCGVSARASVEYTTDGGWKLAAHASVGKQSPVSVKDLIDTYGDHMECLNNGEAPNPFVGSIQASYETESGHWQVCASVDHWAPAFLAETELSARFSIGNTGSFFCELSGELKWNNIDLTVGYSYKNGENRFTFGWNELHGIIVHSEQEYYGELSLDNMKIGTMVEHMVKWVTGSTFGLAEPWASVLNGIGLNAALRYNFKTQKVSLTIKFKEINLGFAAITGISLEYKQGEDGKYGVFISLAGRFSWLGEGKVPQWDAAKPETTPAPKGKGNEYFNLRKLVLGQKAAVFSPPLPQNVSDVMKVLDTLDPSFLPDYDSAVNWLAAIDFGILKQENSKYLLDAQLVFYDPKLYALRISAGGVLNGLVFEILYLKINDSLGVFRGVLTLPEYIRRLDIGAYTLVLPVIAVDVYTDGSFLIDLGFPKGGDFSRSLSFEGMIGPVPVIGAAGIYVGRLSSAAGADIVPPQVNGLFSPITVMGLGLKFGLGKTIEAGVLKAGISLTLTAILEGVFARFSPFDGKEPTDYFKVSGLAAVTGNVYGIIDFGIISASVNALVSVSAAFVFESFRACEVVATASISVSASLKINFGIFSIKISFTFSAEISASFTLGKDETAPWDAVHMPGPLQFVLPAITQLEFDNLIPEGEKIGCRAQVSLPLSVTDRPSKQVTAAVILTMEADDYNRFLEMAAVWLIAAGTAPATAPQILDSCPHKEVISRISALFDSDTVMQTKDILRFLKRFVLIEVSPLDQLMASGEDINGVFFPFPPSTAVNGLRFEDKYQLSQQTIASMKAQFRKLALIVEQAEGEKWFQRNEVVISAAEWLFRDYFLFMFKQLLKSMEQYADGKTPLHRILKNPEFQQIGGMVSRYNLHGLRIPLDDGNEEPVLELAGQLFHDVAQEDMFVVSSDEPWLSVPADYTLIPEEKTYRLFAEVLTGEEYIPRYQAEAETAVCRPVTYSFPAPYAAGDITVWDVPDILPRGESEYAFQFLLCEEETYTLQSQMNDKIPEIAPACLVPLTAVKTSSAGVYTILSSTERCAAALADMVKCGRTISNVCLYYNSKEKKYVRADTLQVAAARLDQSTQTHPPLNSQGKESWEKLAVLLFEALVTNNQGYILIAPTDTPLPEEIFNERGEVFLTLAFFLGKGTTVSAPCVSAMVSTDNTAGKYLISAQAKNAFYQLPLSSESRCAVNVGYAIRRKATLDDPAAALMEQSFSLMRYTVKDTGDFWCDGYSMPVSCTDGDTYRFAVPADQLAQTTDGFRDYSAVGHMLSVQGQWLDVFGNLYGSSFELSTLCGYQDSLTALSAYPYLQISFTVADRTVILRGVLADRKQVPDTSMKTVRLAYEKIMRELTDSNGVTAAFCCPVLSAGGPVPLLQWAVQAMDYFEGKTETAELCCSYPISRHGVSGKHVELQPISASVRISRTGKAQSGFEGVPNILSVCSEIPVSGELSEFAKAYEDSVGSVRVVRNREQLYEAPDLSPLFQFTKSRVYTPIPLFHTLFTGTVQGLAYQKGIGLVEQDFTYTGADGNRLLRNALSSIDALFSPDIAAALNLCRQELDSFEEIRKSIAKQLAQRLCVTSGAKASVPGEHVQESFYQQMLSRLSNYYDVRGIAELDCRVDAERPNTRVYGTIHGKTGAQGLDFGTAKITLEQGETRLAAVMKGPEVIRDGQGNTLPYTEIELDYEITHIESEIQEVVDGYDTSQWYSGVSESTIASPDLKTAGVVILPFPILYFPEAPVFTDQKFLLDDITVCQKSMDFTARYQVSYTKAHHYPQVKDRLTVYYNPESGSRAGVNPLFSVLASFDHGAEEILSQLHSLAGQVLESYPQVSESVDEVIKLMSDFFQLCTALEQALRREPEAPRSLYQGEPVVFSVDQGQDKGRFTLCLDEPGVLPLIEEHTTEHLSDNTYLFIRDGNYLTPAQGQQIQKRTFLLPPVKILSHASASTEMYAEINSTLIPGIQSPSALMLRSDIIAFGSQAHADFTITDQIDLIEKYAVCEINLAIRMFLEDVIDDCTPEVSCECRRISPSGEEFPLFLQIPIVDTPERLSHAWAQRINEWMDTVPVPLKQNKGFRFRLNLSFGNTLKIPNVLITVYG